jgi:UrcA family protein
MDLSHRNAVGSLMAGFLCVVSGLATAGQPTGIVVPYGDLDLNTPRGVTTMYARLEAAAKTTCTAHEGTWSRDLVTLCVDDSVRRAVAQVGAPRLVVLYEIRTGRLAGTRSGR